MTHAISPLSVRIFQVANDTVSVASAAGHAAASDSRARSLSTPERTETVDVHHSREPRSIHGQHHHHDADMDREMDVESPITSNNSGTSSSPQHPSTYHYHLHQPQGPTNPSAAGGFHSLPRTGGGSSTLQPSPSVAGQIENPCHSSNPVLKHRPGRGSSISSCLLPTVTTATTSPSSSSSPLKFHTDRSRSPPSINKSGTSQEEEGEEEDSFCSSEYTDPNTFPTEVAAGHNCNNTTTSAMEDPVSRDSYELLSESEPILFSPDPDVDPAVPYILHRRLDTSRMASKSCETMRTDDVAAARIGHGCGDIGVGGATADGASSSFHMVQRSRSFRSLREKTYPRDKPHALFARARLVEIDLNVIDPQPSTTSLFRPKSIEFVSYQHLPPPDAFSSRDDTLDPAVVVVANVVNDDENPAFDLEFVPSHYTSDARPSFPVVVDVDKENSDKIESCNASSRETSQEEAQVCGRREAAQQSVKLDDDKQTDSGQIGDQQEQEEEEEEEEDKMCSLMSQTEEEEAILTATSSVSIQRPVETEEDEALTADDVRDVDLIYQDTLSSTSLEEHLLSEDQIFEFVNEEDGLPDPDAVRGGGGSVYDRVPAASVEYVFQAHVLSRISERSCDSKLSSCTDDGGAGGAQHERNNTMSDVSSSFKASEIDGQVDIESHSPPPLPAGSDSGSGSPPMQEPYLPSPPPPPPLFEETTPVNETVVFDPPPYPASTTTDEFPSPPSSIDMNLAEEESYSDSSS